MSNTFINPHLADPLKGDDKMNDEEFKRKLDLILEIIEKAEYKAAKTIREEEQKRTEKDND